MCLFITSVMTGFAFTLMFILVGVPFLFAWLSVTIVGIYIQYRHIMLCRNHKPNPAIAFWIMIGATIPVYWVALW